ncbi:hypothetical protein OFB79_24155, partial [Escherichia coli]|nr:hypothetical protein [Escherichia coli]
YSKAYKYYSIYIPISVSKLLISNIIIIINLLLFVLLNIVTELAILIVLLPIPSSIISFYTPSTPIPSIKGISLNNISLKICKLDRLAKSKLLKEGDLLLNLGNKNNTSGNY